MRYVPWMLSASLLIACAGEPSRPSPSIPSTGAPNPGKNAFLVLVVADSTWRCIPGGSIRVISGQLAGETRTQDGLPCSVWDYGIGVHLSGLEPGVEMTIEASARGYVARSETFRPTPFPQTAYFFTLAPE